MNTHLDVRLSWWLSADDKAGQGRLQTKGIVAIVDYQQTRYGRWTHFYTIRPILDHGLGACEGHACYLIGEARAKTDSGKSIRLPRCGGKEPLTRVS